MKQNDLTKAITHNKNVLKELGISISSAEKGIFSVALEKRKVKRKNLATGMAEEKEVFFLVSKCGRIGFPVDLLVIDGSQGSQKVSTKLEIFDIEYNSKGYIQRIKGIFQ